MRRRSRGRVSRSNVCHERSRRRAFRRVATFRRDHTSNAVRAIRERTDPNAIGTPRDVSLFISRSRRAMASTDRNSSSRNARRHSRRLSFPLVVFGMVRARTSRTSRSSSRNPCDAATATRTSSTSFAAERALDAEGSPSRTSATTITTGFDAVSSATNAAMPPARRRPAPASATTRSTSCGATLRPPTTMRSFERPTRKSSPSRRKPSSPVRRYALDATDRAPGETTRETPPHSPASSASFAPNPCSPSRSSSSFRRRRRPNVGIRTRRNRSVSTPRRRTRRAPRVVSHGPPPRASPRRTARRSSRREPCSNRPRRATRRRLARVRATLANRRVPRAAVARVHDALRQTVPRDERARTKPVRFERARAKMADVSGCTRSDALRQRLSEDKSTEDTSVSRPSAGDARHRSARHPSLSLRAQTVREIGRLRHRRAVLGHDQRPRRWIAHERSRAREHARVVDAGASTSSPAMVSGARYPPTRPMS